MKIISVKRINDRNGNKAFRNTEGKICYLDSANPMCPIDIGDSADAVVVSDLKSYCFIKFQNNNKTQKHIDGVLINSIYDMLKNHKRPNAIIEIVKSKINYLDKIDEFELYTIYVATILDKQILVCRSNTEKLTIVDPITFKVVRDLTDKELKDIKKIAKIDL